MWASQSELGRLLSTSHHPIYIPSQFTLVKEIDIKKSKSLNINLVCWELIDLEGNVKRINMWKHFIANRDTKTMLWNGNNYRHGLWHCGDKFTWASKFPSGEWVVPVVWLWKSCGWALDRLRMRVCHKRGGHESFTVALYYFCFHCRASLSL